MLNYKNSMLCLHLEDICDRHIDCPQMDDEVMCHMNKKLCPEQCQCLNFAIFCVKDNFASKALQRNLPYISMSIIFCNLTAVHVFTTF